MPHPLVKIKVFIEKDKDFTAPLSYTWNLFAKNKSIDFVFVNDKDGADIILEDSPVSHFPLAAEFYRSIHSGRYSYEKYFASDCLIRNSEGKPDYLATAFYMVNSIQEYNHPAKDGQGRFPYAASYQCQYRNLQDNLVQQYFCRLIEESPVLRKHMAPGAKSRIYLSHDIDQVYNAWMEDGMAAIRQGKLLKLFSLFFNVVIGKPDWLNMDKIMKIESEYDFKSAFFWIVNKGGKNADYSIRSGNITQAIAEVEHSGFENGLHKSLSAESIESEIHKAPFSPLANRYHFLKIDLPGSYEQLHASPIRADSSLGFAEQAGFRNSYGQPFRPYGFRIQREYDFLEIPLLVMDRTFHSYLKIPVEEVARHVIGFLEKNSRDCVFSVLWHNNFFGSVKYQGYFEEYKKILDYLYQNRYETVTTAELCKEYSIPEKKREWK